MDAKLQKYIHNHVILLVKCIINRKNELFFITYWQISIQNQGMRRDYIHFLSVLTLVH